MKARTRQLNVCTIAAGAPFLRVLADALFNGALTGAPLDSADPLALARCTILLPTRRACRIMRDVLVARQGGGPLLLPRIRALGDVDAAELALDPDSLPNFPDPRLDPSGIPPAMDTLERQLILTRLIQKWGEVNAAQVMRLAPGEAPVIPGSPGHAARLAGDLARLMDAVETEGVDFSAVAGIVPADHAGYWQITLSFLDIITRTWPEILRARDALPAAARRNQLIDAETARLERMQPKDPLIAAGSTGSVPATARLLRSIAGLPQGAVVLPGFDAAMDKDMFDVIASGDGTSSHPQHGMARLIKGMGLLPQDVHALGKPDPVARARSDLSLLAMKPASMTGSWKAGSVDIAAISAGLQYLEADDLHHEALLIALLMREALEVPGRTMALVTPDRELARRVQAELKRWDIELDDSAGTPLAQTPPGLLMRHLAQLLLEGLAPVPLLALLKHPLCRLGLPAQETRRRARLLERLILRGPRPDPTFAGLKAALDAANADDTEKLHCRELTERLEAAIGALTMLRPAGHADMGALLKAHAGAAAEISRDEDGVCTLHDGDAGAALAQFFDQATAGMPQGWQIAPGNYPDLFAALIAGRPVRSRAPRHPRLQILGLLEARLSDADCIVLGGLNEGTWPAETTRDPWLNRAMRSEIGLSAPERRIGLVAHDFVQAFCNADVILTRAKRQNGAQTVASRFLLRIDAALKALRHETGLAVTATPLGRAATALLNVDKWSPAPPPAPTPPLDARPATISVTQVETWVRDPYAFYARNILRLRPLDPLDAAPDAAGRGTLLHAIFGAFMSANPDFSDKQQALAALTAIGAREFATLADAPQIKSFWWRRFVRAAQWFVDFEAQHTRQRVDTFSEIGGVLNLGDVIEIQARADRIDRLADGSLSIIDYKTGVTATAKEILAGFAPQLPLEAAIALSDGFNIGAGGPITDVSGLAFMRLTGVSPPGDFVAVTAATPAELAMRSSAGLKRLAEAFARQEQPYYSRTGVRQEGQFDGDYDHLARAREWSRRIEDAV